MRNVAALCLATFFSNVLCSQVPNPDLDLSTIGHVVLAGQFSGISIYDDSKQTEVLSTGSTDGLYLQSTDGTYTLLGATDGAINAICTYNGSLAETIFVGGNFSRIGTVAAANVASYNVATQTFGSLSTGVLGTVNTLLCESASDQVYLGGSFEMSNSTNAVIWNVAHQRFDSIPFGGFDGQVNTIVSSGSSIIFGGKFDSVSEGNSSSTNPIQQVNLQTAYVSREDILLPLRA